MVIHAIFAAIFWFLSGRAIEMIYRKAGFIHTPKFIFWIPVFHFAFLIHLAFCKWPIDENPDNHEKEDS